MPVPSNSSTISTASSTLETSDDNLTPTQTKPFKFQPVMKTPSFDFKPMPYKESLVQWWQAPGQKAAEENVLKFLPFYPEPDETRQATLTNVETGKNRHMHEFRVTNTQQIKEGEKGKNIVIMHGYGAGLGFFFQNFDELSSLPGSTLYALDWLGFGLSSRPRFSIPTKDYSIKDRNGAIRAVKESEDWFLAELEKWRKIRQLDKFVLIGHSLGGYLSAVYAMRYPQHVEKLILISPAGVDRGYTPDMDRRWQWGNSRPKKSAKDTMDEANEDLAKSLSTKPTMTQNAAMKADLFEQDLERVKSVDSLNSEKSTSKIHMPKLVSYLWNSHLSPFDLLRGSTFFGPKLLSQWSQRRFGLLPQEEQQAMHVYAFRTLTAKGSGEYAITRLLAPGAVARMPLVDRVARGKGIHCPSLWIYGDSDWMNVDAGDEAVKRLIRGGRTADFHVVEKAGHHVYLDNPETCNSLVLDFIKR